MVSRTSIDNDLNEIRESLDKYNLELSRTLKGTRIVGSEINIRKAWVFAIQEYGKSILIILLNIKIFVIRNLILMKSAVF